MAAIRGLGASLVVVIALGGCADDGAPDQSVQPAVGGAGAGWNNLGAGSGGLSAGGGTTASAAPAGSGSPPASSMDTPPTGGSSAAPADAGGLGTTAGAGGSGATAGTGASGSDATAGTGAAGSAGSTNMPPAASGPKDGDPSKPIVAIDGIPCGPSQAGPAGGNFEIGGRKLIVDYPCEKHEGAHVTVILNLHGTLISGAPYSYQHAYFSAHRLVTSHNLIVLTPKSVSTASFGAQWGNMDNGEDLPHLLAVIDWAYTTFAKFQIRGLWIGGHSWGAAFVTAALGGGPFACHPMLMDKVKGAIGMSRLSMPSCASRLSLIATRGETENIALLDQNSVAMGHGCMTPMQGPEALGNNEYRHYAGCSPGWVHEDYHMLGKGHIDNMDAAVVEKIVNAIKSTEQ
jgi:hypothetical protein